MPLAILKLRGFIALPRCTHACSRSLRRGRTSDGADYEEEPVADVTVSVPVPTSSGLHPARLATFPVRPYRRAPADRLSPTDNPLPADRLPPSDRVLSAGAGRHLSAAAENAEIVGSGGGGSTTPAAAEERESGTGASEQSGTRVAGDIAATCLKLDGRSSACTECTVCLCDFNEGELVRSLPPCAHRFHVSCIDHWLAARTTCPVCRIDLEAAAPDAAEKKVTTLKVEGNEAG